MAKYSICLEPVLNDMEFCDRIKVAADIGFDAIEFWEPTEKNIGRIGKLTAEHNIPVIGCTLLNQWEIRANDDIGRILKNLEHTIEFTAECGCTTFMLMTGDIESRVDSQKNILIENLKKMADLAEKKSVTLLLESLNSLVDHKGYYLDSACLGYEIIKCVGSDRVKFLFDCYHMQIMEGNLIENMVRNLKYTGHVHCAGVPGRNEPFIGEINYPNVIKSALNAGYDGYFGLEYWPTYENIQSLIDSLACLKG